MKVERRRGQSVKPIPSVREGKRVEAGAVSGRRRGEKLREIVRVHFRREGVLSGGRRKQSQGGVSGVVGVALEKTEGRVWKRRLGGVRENRLDDRVGCFGGSDEGGCACFGGRNEAGAAELDGEEGLSASGVIQFASEKKSERGELKRVEVGVDGEKRIWVASAETIGHRGEREAESEEAKF